MCRQYQVLHGLRERIAQHLVASGIIQFNRTGTDAGRQPDRDMYHRTGRIGKWIVQ